MQVFDLRPHPVGDAIEWRRLLGVSWQLVLDGADHHLQPAPPQPRAAHRLELRQREAEQLGEALQQRPVPLRIELVDP